MNRYEAGRNVSRGMKRARKLRLLKKADRPITLTPRETKILRVVFEELRNHTRLSGDVIMWLKREVSTNLKIRREERYYSI